MILNITVCKSTIPDCYPWIAGRGFEQQSGCAKQRQIPSLGILRIGGLLKLLHHQRKPQPGTARVEER